MGGRRACRLFRPRAIARESYESSMVREEDGRVERGCRLHQRALRLHALRRLREAEVACREALALIESALGRKSADAANVIEALARIRVERGDLGDALRLYRRAEAIVRGARAGGDTARVRVQVLTGLEEHGRRGMTALTSATNGTAPSAACSSAPPSVSTDRRRPTRRTSASRARSSAYWPVWRRGDRQQVRLPQLAGSDHDGSRSADQRGRAHEANSGGDPRDPACRSRYAAEDRGLQR